MEGEVDLENALTPIVFIDDGLYFFNVDNGNVYRLSDGIVGRLESQLHGFFAVPGDDRIYSPQVSGGLLRLKLRKLSDISSEEEFDLGDDYGGRPVGVIPGGEDRYLVLRLDGQPKVIFVSLETGKPITHYIPNAARPLFMTMDGHVVYQKGQFWGSTREGHVLERGIISNWSSQRFIVVSNPKDERIYTEFFSSGKRILHAPAGWEIRQAVTYSTGTLLICLHPCMGYAVWDEKNLVCVEGTATLYSLGDSEPVVRTAGYALGSVWCVGERQVYGLVRPRQGVHIEVKRIGDCPCLRLTSDRRSRELLVAFHGGPDSLEWDDLRYGGMYRDVLDQGMDVLIVNYPGSHGFGTAHQRKAWRAWGKTLETLGSQIQRFCDDAGYVRVKMLGVSFGAWVALITSNYANVERVVAVSPMFQLSSHIRKHRDDEHFRDWAEARFGDCSKISDTDQRLGEVRAVVVPILAADDRSIDGDSTIATCRNFEWTPIKVPGGHYPVGEKDAQTRWQTIMSAILD